MPLKQHSFTVDRWRHNAISHQLFRIQKRSGCGKALKTRSATAFECFVNTKNEDFEFDDRPKWKRYEEANDPYLLQKSTFTYTRRIVGFVVDTEDEYRQKSEKYPGCIVYANRVQVPDFKNAVKDTNKLSQVAFCKHRENNKENEVFLNLQNYPCRCIQCCNHFFDKNPVVGCHFTALTNTRRQYKLIMGTIVVKRTVMVMQLSPPPLT
jgi:hypothetical protein